MARARVFGWLGAVVVLAVAGTVLIGGVAVDRYTSTPEFCGNTCHVMKAAYESWKVSEHKDLSCLACHATDGEVPAPYLSFQGLKQAYSYVMRGEGEHPRVRPVINDLSCAASGCHTGQDFLKKESDFAKKEGIRFIHLSHKVKAFDKKVDFLAKVGETNEVARAKSVPGHELHCDTCHLHQSVSNHFEVPKEICFLCHFKEQGFNTGRSACDLCHDIPTKSLQAQKSDANSDQKAITHKILIEANVACEGCHLQLVSGSGNIKTENCRDCHFDPETLAKTGRDNMELLHKKHVAGQQASCFDCHQPIEHKDGGDFLDLVRLDCQSCHPDHHRFQKTLLAGTGVDGVRATPNPMFRVKTNCLGCHIKEKEHKGQPFFVGAGEACARCHTESEAKLVEKWRNQLWEEIEFVRDLEYEAEDALATAAGKVPATELEEANAMMENGRELLHTVQFGNGVHNKKFALMLLDEAVGHFEDVIDAVQN